VSLYNILVADVNIDAVNIAAVPAAPVSDDVVVVTVSNAA